MALHVLAVGTRMPGWITEGVHEYTRRMPPECPVGWQEIKAETRTGTGTAARCMMREAVRLRAALPANAWRIVLDDKGRAPDTRQFAERLAHWQTLGRPAALVIGGPDGLDPAFKAEADETLSLSRLTLPHPIVRVVLAEQLYRAWSLMAGHPYHRA
ncbi:MAG: 23S rRNA (pseudouridine(1915)-N(3))-methyltransferase RlmH [Burkholderiaceae bacterium]